MSEQIILFDIPSKAPHGCWSFNPWKSEPTTEPLILKPGV